MANPAHLEKLCEGPKAWNAWREANPNIVPDLSGIQLTLHQRQLGPSNGGPIDLHAADLEQAVLRNATLTGADLEGCRLVGADLTHARLDKARLACADLTDAVLDQADLTGAMLDQAVLFGADLSDTRNLTLTQIEQAFGDNSTKLPSNLLPPDSWFPAEHEDDDDYAGWGMASYEEPVEQSLYEVLGLTPKAGSEEIRAAYRILVKKLHPDLNPNDEEAQDRFKQVTTAYRILNDAEQRARYDRNEIDGEGRVNPEFEARRQFRRTAYRYYAAAAASFMLACGVLVGVWYTVLSINAPEETAPQVAVVAPKRSERLGEGAASSQVRIIVRSEKDFALLEEGQAPPGSDTAPASEAASPDQETAPGTTENGEKEEAAAETPAAAADTPAKADAPQDAYATPAPDKPVEVAVVDDTPQPAEASAADAEKPATPAPIPANAEAASAAPPQVASPSSQPAGDSAQQTPVAAPSVQPPGQAAQTPQPVAEARQAAAPSQPAPQKGTAQGPLRDGHNSWTGQTKPSAPEGWSVASLPSSAQQGWPESAGNTQTGAHPRLEKISLPRPAQHPAGRDIVSQVLRARAIRQALGEGKRPFASAESVALPRRRAALGRDFPTNALPGKRTATPVKPTAASLQRKTAANRDPSASAPMAAASKAPVAPQNAAKRQSRQQQAVTDILAGGL